MRSRIWIWEKFILIIKVIIYIILYDQIILWEVIYIYTCYQPHNKVGIIILILFKKQIASLVLIEFE